MCENINATNCTNPFSMRVIQKTERLLKLKENNWALFFGGFVFIVVGLVAIYSSLSEGSTQPWWYGAVIVVVGILFFLFVYTTTIIFDKSMNTVLVARKSLLRKSEDIFPLDHVAAIELRFDSIERRKSSPPNMSKNTREFLEKPTYVYKLAAVLKDGQKFLITTFRTSVAAHISIGATKAKSGVYDDVGPIVAEFLNVPYQTQGETSEVRFWNNILQS